MPVTRDSCSMSGSASADWAGRVLGGEREAAPDEGTGEMADSTNRFTVFAASSATRRTNSRFTVQKYFRKKSSITLPRESRTGGEQARCHRGPVGPINGDGQALEIIPE